MYFGGEVGLVLDCSNNSFKPFKRLFFDLRSPPMQVGYSEALPTNFYSFLRTIQQQINILL